MGPSREREKQGLPETSGKGRGNSELTGGQKVGQALNKNHGEGRFPFVGFGRENHLH